MSEPAGGEEDTSKRAQSPGLAEPGGPRALMIPRACAAREAEAKLGASVWLVSKNAQVWGNCFGSVTYDLRF